MYTDIRSFHGPNNNVKETGPTLVFFYLWETTLIYYLTNWKLATKDDTKRLFVQNAYLLY